MFIYTLLAAQSGPAAGGALCALGGICNPVIADKIGKLTNQADAAVRLAGVIAIFLRISLIGASVISLLYLIWGAFDWITSSGDKAAVEGARLKMTHAIIGLCLIAIILLLFNFIGSFLQIDLLNLTIPTAENL